MLTSKRIIQRIVITFGAGAAIVLALSLYTSATGAPLSFDPTKLKGLSEKLIVSRHNNNYGGTVKRLNAITALEALDGPILH